MSLSLNVAHCREDQLLKRDQALYAEKQETLSWHKICQLCIKLLFANTHAQEHQYTKGRFSESVHIPTQSHRPQTEMTGCNWSWQEFWFNLSKNIHDKSHSSSMHDIKRHFSNKLITMTIPGMNYGSHKTSILDIMTVTL